MQTTEITDTLEFEKDSPTKETEIDFNIRILQAEYKKKVNEVGDVNKIDLLLTYARMIFDVLSRSEMRKEFLKQRSRVLTYIINHILEPPKQEE